MLACVVWNRYLRSKVFTAVTSTLIEFAALLFVVVWQSNFFGMLAHIPGSTMLSFAVAPALAGAARPPSEQHDRRSSASDQQGGRRRAEVPINP
jgi:hypothetical protein